MSFLDKVLLRVLSAKQTSWQTFLVIKKKVYLGVSETTFKVRYGNHKKLLTKQRHKNDTELSREYWKVKTFFCDEGLMELVDDSYKIKQTKEREFVEDTLAELTNQCTPFF